MNVKRSDRKSPKIPRRPETLSCHYEKNGESLTLREKRTLTVDGGATTVFTIFWTIGCVLLVYGVLDKPSIFRFCVAFPFWAMWFILFIPVMAIWFGQKTFRLDADGVWYEYRVLFRITSRRVPLGEIRRFRTVSHSVAVMTDGKPVEFSAADFKEAKWLAYEMNRLLAELRGEPVEAVPDFARIKRKQTKKKREDQRIPWNALPMKVWMPKDCRWMMKTECDSVTFWKQRKFSLDWLAELGVSTFGTLFWNGILSMFLLVIFGFLEGGPEFLSGAWWGLFAFLIPFEIIGFYHFMNWFFILSSPFQCTRWRVDRYEAECRTAWFGIGWSRRYLLENCREMVIRLWNPEEIWWIWMRIWQFSRMAHQGPPIYRQDVKTHKIMFVGRQDEALCEIRDLTDGEARWIADNILLYR